MAKAKKKSAKKKKTVKKPLRQVRLIVINTNGGEHEIFEGTEHTARTAAEEYIEQEMWENGDTADSIDDWLVFEITDDLGAQAEDKVKVVIKYEN